MIDVYSKLEEIVGKKHVSNEAEELYFYGRDPSLESPHPPSYVAAPRTTEEVQGIVKLANKVKMPLVVMGGGMSLAGLVIPLKGGIVIDMKRMEGIIEVNEKSRYAIIEGGVTQGALRLYLERNHPKLRHNIPEAPAGTTIASSAVIHGHGRLSHQYGFTSDMVSGMEVVLPNGETCKIGSCAMSPDWFSKGPSLPDLSGLFLGWFGTTGIITKLGLKLYPRKKFIDVELFVTDKPELVPDIMFNLTHLEILEDILFGSQSGMGFDPPMPEGFHFFNIYFTGDTLEEIEFKRKMLWNSLKAFRKNKDGGFMWVPSQIKPVMLENPQRRATRMLADDKKGGGFIYSVSIIPIEKYAILDKAVNEISKKYDVAFCNFSRPIGPGHSMMSGPGFPFNRIDTDMTTRVKKAIHEVTEFYYDQGGIPWKANVKEQKIAMKMMDPSTLKLMKMIKETLDPNGIMSPGNWEIK